MALIDIARNVLKQNNNRPMTAKEIIGYIISNNLWSPPKGGVTPEDTLAERINSDIKRGMSFFTKRNGKFRLTTKGQSDARRVTDGGKKGYVYVISNVRSLWRRDWVKIGSSNLNVGGRIYTLNQAVPYNFKVEVLMRTVGYKAVEDRLQKQFAMHCGDEDSKEYFTVSPAEVAAAMRELCTKRTYRGAEILEDTTDHDEIVRILRKSKNDPTKRRARRRRGVV